MDLKAKGIPISTDRPRFSSLGKVIFIAMTHMYEVHQEFTKCKPPVEQMQVPPFLGVTLINPSQVDLSTGLHTVILKLISKSFGGVRAQAVSSHTFSYQAVITPLGIAQYTFSSCASSYITGCLAQR